MCTVPPPCFFLCFFINLAIQSLQYFDISNNNITIPFPHKIHSNTKLQYLSFRNNHLYGSFPRDIKQLFNLKFLDLESSLNKTKKKQLDFEKHKNLDLVKKIWF